MSVAETEAEALLRHGALYPIRQGLLPVDGGPLAFVGIKHGAASIYLGDEPSYHFDLEGRWHRCYSSPSHYLRRLDGSTQAIDRPRVGRNMRLDRRTLDPSEADRLDASIRAMALGLADRIASGSVTLVDPPPPARPIGADGLRTLLGRVSAWDASAWAEHRRRYRSTYGPNPFLPPDGLDALVLQATVGPPAGGGPVHRNPEAFERHCRDVAGLLGMGVVPYRSLFLAGPDSLRRPADEVEASLRIARAVFPLAEGPAPPRRSDLPVERPHREGIHAFVGRSSGPIPGPEDWGRFRALGLRRVAVGIEAGDDPGSDDTTTPPEDVGPIASGAKGAGIAVSVVTWIGPDGIPDRDGSTASAIALVRSLGLGKGDHVYLVGGEERPGAPPDRRAAGRGSAREAELMEGLISLRRSDGVKVLPYLVSKQGF
ncbi:hypothetical protein [Tautonia plasticadhaerens]|uniref:Uncharacterized protein n=1 Tax=Tautonia plasticadhaerens TaxID=2527974 RepID=A0A518GWN8_9BACT|nr:hypothetical protein [Tautonia plasticadhaerens]QDV32972.1 hypothetical protein ElP_08140 [Tautonia plasticadhaerens]